MEDSSGILCINRAFPLSASNPTNRQRFEQAETKVGVDQ